MFRLLWMLVTAVGLLLAGCASPVAPSLLQYTLQPGRLDHPPPAPVAVAPGDQVSELIPDPVRIDPRALANYKDLPATVTQLYDAPARDLSLKDVVNLTLANDRRIRIQAYALRIAECQIPLSKGIYDLLVTAEGAYSRTEQQTTSNSNPSVNRSRLRSGQFGLSQLLPWGAILDAVYQVAAPPGGPYSEQMVLRVTQPLLRGLGWALTNADITLAKLEREGSAADFQAQLETQLASALSAYWDLIGAIQSYKVQTIAYANALGLLEVDREFFTVGLRITVADLYQSEAALQSASDKLITARQSVRDLEDQLKRIIIPREELPRWEEEIRPTQSILWRDIRVDLDQSIGIALARRAGLRRAHSNVDQEDVILRVVRNNLLPQLDFFAQTTPNGMGEDFDSGRRALGNGNTVSYALGLVFSFPLQNRAARFAHKQALARGAREKERLADARDQVTLEVRQAARALRVARERIDVTRSRVTSEEANLDTETQRYQVDLSTTYRIIQFQQDLAAAQSAHVQAIIDVNKAAIALERARGTILETYGIQISKPNLNPPPAEPAGRWGRIWSYVTNIFP